MLTQTVTITQNSTPNIIIGRRGTYETEQVVFDVSWLIDTYGAGSAVLMVHRPTDQTAYPVDVVLDGNTLAWTVSETDTQYKGHGECEIFWYVNDGLAKTCICGITILRDIGDTTETAPDPYETWVETLSRLGAETLANAQAAEQSANSAAQSASESDNSAAAALESEENALNSENAAKASEQAAAASAQGAEQSATAARQSATEAANSASAAESSAANAQESADNSSASADRAEQAAASIEGDTERAEAAARTAQGAASAASGFAGTASTKATEAAGSAATAEQAANTATQQAADASASATAADGSATSASASATAAGNAQTAAETAQGKAEDAQSAAETAAQSIEDSAAQIDTNTADILNLKSALNTKAGIIRDTASGAIASFVPDATVPNLLGLSVALEPIQDLHGYDSPWPAGGGVSKCPMFADGTHTLSNGITVTIKDGEITINGTPNGAGNWQEAITPTVMPENPYVSLNNPIGTYTASLSFIAGASEIGPSLAPANKTTALTGLGGKTVTHIRLYFNGQGSFDNFKLSPIVHEGDTPQTWTPYSNICPISGRESVEVEAAGVNLFDKTNIVNDKFIDDANGAERQGSDSVCTGYIPVAPNITYRIITEQTQGAWGAWYDAEKNYISGIIYYNAGGSRPTQTAPSNARYARLTIVRGGSGNVDTFALNYPSTDHDYHPYSGTTHTIQLGDTVYGGTLDVTNGTLTVDRAMVDLGTLTWNRTTSYSVPVLYTNVAEKLKSNISMLCSIYKFIGNFGGAGGFANASENASIGNCNANKQIFVRDDSYTDVASFASAMSGVQLVYELATPIVIELDPVTIATIANQTNNVWADAGDVSVEFAADLKTYIDNKIAAAVAAMS